MRYFCLSLFLLLPWALFAQDRGTLTGTVSDPAGAVVANAAVEARNLETGVVYPTATTAAGNYTIPQLPVGTYEVTATVAGFKRFVRTGIRVNVAAVERIDILMEVGAATESVTVQADATQLKTESGDLAHNISVDSLDNLPILGIGGANAGSSGIRNPYGLVQLIPGTSYQANFVNVVNGAPSNSGGYRIEGQDMTNHYVSYALQEEQPSADAIQEVAVQTSNYAAEYGTAGGGLYNITMKSGTNQYHGTGYDYFVNEDLNAGYPFTIADGGGKVQPRNRRNDFGGTLGGPVRIPKLYNGHDKTFFFFNYEEYKETQSLNFPLTLPTAAYRNGDFSAISPNGGANFNPGLGVPSAALPSVDALGRPIFANTIYDPATVRAAPNGVMVSDPFPNNMIPVSRINPISQKIQSLFPMPATTSLIGNGFGVNPGERATTIPSVKIDQVITPKGHLSFYWSSTQTDSLYSSPNGNADGLPAEITLSRGTFIHHKIFRLNYDHTLTPTILVHVGAGYQQLNFFDDAPYLSFNAQQQLGLAGFEANRNFPNITNMLAPSGPQAALGGMQNVGTTGQIQSHSYQQRPTANASATWVHGNHTFKLGGEVYWQGTISNPYPGVILASLASAPITNVITSSGATALPFNPPNGLGGQNIGFGYANFLLGDFSTIQQNTGADYRVGKSQWALYLQDSWKITRKLTIDYGARWDYGTYPREEYGRAASFGLIPNPNAGGRIGGTIYEANCNCTFASNYPYAIGPRFGFAYQVTPKTVVRGGWGFIYGFTPDIAGSPAALSQINTPAGVNGYINISSPTALPQPTWPVFTPGLYPTTPGIPGTSPIYLDAQAGRPPRQNQYSIGVQREISPNLLVEASYVANRGVWWTGITQGGSGAASSLAWANQVPPSVFAKYGLNPYTNPADNLLLSSSISSPAVIARVGNVLPYAGFPTTQTLLQALRPFPQFTALAVTDSPTGKTWYDSLQAKVNKRFSHGLQATGTFTWSKALQLVDQNIFNPGALGKTFQQWDQPFLFNANIVYTVPKLFEAQKLLSTAVRDWQFGVFIQEASGFLLNPPAATTVNNLSTGINYQVRVPGVPLYLKDPNGTINPYTDQVLNPAAWTNPVSGSFGPQSLWGDFRAQRRPIENFNFGRNFRIREGMNLQIRAEFVNIFNHTYLGNPLTTAPPTSPIGHNGAGQITGGFGTIPLAVAPGGIPTTAANGNFNTQLGGLPRTGTIIARFSF
jgi:Carboxypeptidase regulatory-like domain/TonB dependent receptor-like, beta-barrel